MIRDGEAQTISVRPEYETAAERTLIGFGFGLESVDVSAGEAAGKAGDAIWLVASGTVHVFSHLFEEEQRKQVSGVVGVSDVANQTLDDGVERRRCSCSPWSASRSA